MRAGTEVLVIGGGPAGSTAAGLLAKQGVRVTLLERETFPRYHIGESILPSCRPIFELLGVWDDLEAYGFRAKGGAYFCWGPEEWEVRFTDLAAGGDDRVNAWQVTRADFDKLLLDHARKLGVEVHEGVTVKEVEFDGDRPVAAHWARGADEGRITFDQLVDASGRHGLLAARQLRTRTLHNVFRNVATWSYWKGARPLGKGPDGAITVASVPDGWFWAIPLHDGTTSVGLVTGRDTFTERRAELGGTDAVYHEALARCPVVLGMLEGAEQCAGTRTERDYSYTSTAFQGPGYLLCGDAACFLDPLLSTGVHLATYSAMLAAAAIGSVRRGEVTEPEARAFFETVYRGAYERLLVLVSVFYESYRGKEYHFFNAQRLSAADRDELDLQASFDRIVTGIADLKDAEDVYRRVRQHLEGGESGDPNPLANLNKEHELRSAPFGPDRAVGGLYLSYEPQLTLRRA
ncbi:FAD-binding protein [Streptomyces mashuensis]|uniref:FAD-binding protein n=1 Tax=Streptomyces mashuensis TaxID=33904 RepID=A0A919B6Y8_9ACTN|nr:NAD(P)/FAD-dependent oxidoreductase [Streptomyces mashuensis]GHF65437.1 FAD-binding protein [Streptomyces mashuensis]